jgi:putative copper export protein
MSIVLWFHLVAAAVWLGGLITLGAIVAALRSEQVERSVLQAVARQFGRVSWTAMGVAVLSGAWLATEHLGSVWLPVKMALVAVAAGLAAWHQFAARNQSPAMRGILQVLILVASFAVFAAGVALGGS